MNNKSKGVVKYEPIICCLVSRDVVTYVADSELSLYLFESIAA